VSGSNKDAYLRRLEKREFYGAFDWDEWLAVSRPYPEVDFSTTDVVTRFNRNGYDWDIHGLLYQPAREVDPTVAIVIMHGGAGSSRGKDTTPDGRPGIARVLAGQGFKVLSLDYVGHYPPGAIWMEPIAERQPYYLLDRKLSKAEILDRNLKVTFNTEMQGAAALVDLHLAGRKILGFGHSTGGPMVADLYAFTKKTQVIGLIGWGSGGAHCWKDEWIARTKHVHKPLPLDHMSRRSLESFRSAGYESLRELTPWGGAEEFMKWAFHARSQIKTAICDNQMFGAVETLEEYVRVTGLPHEEYFDYLEPQDPDWLASIGVIRLFGERDRYHWSVGERFEDKYDVYWGAKYAEHSRRVHVAYVPKYGHYGMMELHNEKIAYVWLNAFKIGFFQQ
jgi:hypothetical protein